MSTEASSPLGRNPSALPLGTRLGEFELRSLLGIGGFGIVYLAFDHALEREVAVKEYMPASLAGRTETLHVSLRSQSDAETFALGLRSFVNEAKLLARFDHPSLLKVLRFWEANGTAYMAMPVLRGHTLKELRREMAMPPDEAWLRELLVPLLGAIETLHDQGVYHRDIAPDNIQIEPGGHPVLLDFGAARRVISDVTHTLTAILKPAYAPIEQYADSNAVKQGPWTDLYALGATLHYMLLNRPPAPATTRAVFDEPSALSVQACAGCSADFLRTIDWMLAPRPADRPQSVAALREVLEGRAALPSAYATTLIQAPAPDDGERTVVVPRTVPPPAPAAASTATPAVAPAAPPAKAGTWIPVAAGAGVLAVALAAWVMWPRSAPAPAVVATQAPAPAPAPADPAPAAAPPVETMPAKPLPESAVAAVVLPGVAPVKPAAVAAATLAPSPAPKPVVRAAAPAPAPVAAPVAPPPVAAAPEVVPPRTESVAATPPAPAQTPQPVVQGPEARCVGRNPIAHFGCMERECLRGQFKAHPDCLKWRASATERRE